MKIRNTGGLKHKALQCQLKIQQREMQNQFPDTAKQTRAANCIFAEKLETKQRAIEI